MLVWVLLVTALLVSDVAGKGKEPGKTAEKENKQFKREDIIQGRCDKGWFEFSVLNSCYQYFCDKKTWNDAEEFCKSLPHGGHLASVTSRDHNSFTSEVIKAAGGNNAAAWIGLNLLKGEDFTWVDGTDRTYEKWGKGEPNNKGNEKCVLIRSGSGADWNDMSCDKKFGFVCSYVLH